MSVDIHALSGAYAVDALDDLERAHFERHLADCATCRLEVDGLREAASLLAETCPLPVPEALRDRVLGDVAAVRPLPPMTVRSTRSTRRRLVSLVAAAAAFVAIGGVGATVWHPWSASTSSAYAQSEWDTVLHAPDVQRASEPLLDGQGTATIYRSASHDMAVMDARGLPAPPHGKVYEMWLIHNGLPERAGQISQGGDVKAVLAGNPASADGVAVSVEDVGSHDDLPSSDLVASVRWKA